MSWDRKAVEALSLQKTEIKMYRIKAYSSNKEQIFIHHINVSFDFVLKFDSVKFNSSKCIQFCYLSRRVFGFKHILQSSILWKADWKIYSKTETFQAIR
jgi:hypothetical protein